MGLASNEVQGHRSCSMNVRSYVIEVVEVEEEFLIKILADWHTTLVMSKGCGTLQYI